MRLGIIHTDNDQFYWQANSANITGQIPLPDKSNITDVGGDLNFQYLYNIDRWRAQHSGIFINASGVTSIESIPMPSNPQNFMYIGGLRDIVLQDYMVSPTISNMTFDAGSPDNIRLIDSAINSSTIYNDKSDYLLSSEYNADTVLEGTNIYPDMGGRPPNISEMANALGESANGSFIEFDININQAAWLDINFIAYGGWLNYNTCVDIDRSTFSYEKNEISLLFNFGNDEFAAMFMLSQLTYAIGHKKGVIEDPQNILGHNLKFDMVWITDFSYEIGKGDTYKVRAKCKRI